MGLDMKLIAHVAIEGIAMCGFNVLDVRVTVGQWHGAEYIHEEFMKLHDPDRDGVGSIYVPPEFLKELKDKCDPLILVGANNEKEKKYLLQYTETFYILQKIKLSGIADKAYFVYSY